MVSKIKPNILYSGRDTGGRHFFVCTNRKMESRLYFKKNSKIYCVAVEHINNMDPDKLEEVMEFKDYRSVNPFVRRYYGNV